MTATRIPGRLASIPTVEVTVGAGTVAGRDREQADEQLGDAMPALLENGVARALVDRPSRAHQCGKRRLGGVERPSEARIEVGGCPECLEVILHDRLAVDDEGPAAREALAKAPAGVYRRLDANDHRRSGDSGLSLERRAHLEARNEVSHRDITTGSERRSCVVCHEDDVAPAPREPQGAQVGVERAPNRPVDEDVAVGRCNRQRG